MGPFALLNHCLNLLLPALGVGLLLALAGALLARRRRGLWRQVLQNSAAGALALLAGLWFFGVDGKMASYAALVLCCTLSQGMGVRGSK